MLRHDFECLLKDIPQIKDRKIYIWGTGNTASLYQQGLERLEGEGFIIEAYVDNNSSKWGGEFAGKKIVSPDEVKNGANVILVCSPQPKVVKSIFAQLESMGKMEYYHIDELIFKLHKKEIITVAESFADGESKDIYYDLIESRMAGKYPDNKNYSPNQYFALPQFVRRNTDEIFVDCGAYVGDSIEQFLWQHEATFKKIIAFEPDRSNYSAMKKRIGRLVEEWNLQDGRIECLQYALGNEKVLKKIESYANNNGLGSKLTDAISTGENCQVVTIDEMIQEPITFLKADIESYEYNMLEGARACIKRWKPLLAICIYHNAIDMYTIPLLIKEIVPEYKLAIRHHSYQLDETVLYAWVDE